MTISGTYFEHNSASQNGGGLAVNHEGAGAKITELSDCTFYDNTAGESGGAIFNALVLGATAPAMRRENCTIAGNSAETGGGVFNATLARSTTARSPATRRLPPAASTPKRAPRSMGRSSRTIPRRGREILLTSAP